MIESLQSSSARLIKASEVSIERNFRLGAGAGGEGRPHVFTNAILATVGSFGPGIFEVKIGGARAGPLILSRGLGGHSFFFNNSR